MILLFLLQCYPETIIPTSSRKIGELLQEKIPKELKDIKILVEDNPINRR